MCTHTHVGKCACVYTYSCVHIYVLVHIYVCWCIEVHVRTCACYYVYTCAVLSRSVVSNSLQLHGL